MKNLALYWFMWFESKEFKMEKLRFLANRIWKTEKKKCMTFDCAKRGMHHLWYVSKTRYVIMQMDDSKLYFDWLVKVYSLVYPTPHWSLNDFDYIRPDNVCKHYTLIVIYKHNDLLITKRQWMYENDLLCITS